MPCGKGICDEFMRMKLKIRIGAKKETNNVKSPAGPEDEGKPPLQGDSSEKGTEYGAWCGRVHG